MNYIVHIIHGWSHVIYYLMKWCAEKLIIWLYKYTVAHNGGIFFFIPIYGIILKII